MSYDYFYEEQADQFVFYRVPKALCVEEEFRDLSSDAKLLYGLLLDRVSLSAKNGWVDDSGRIYVICTIESIKQSLCCADKKATRLLRELEGHGLIERKKRGQGKPTIFYVKNFIHRSEQRFQTGQNDDSRQVKTTILDSSKQQGNNTEKNNTNNSDTNPIVSGDEDTDERNQYLYYFREQLSFESLLEQYPFKRQMLQEILDLLVDTVCSKKKTITIAGDQKPISVVKSVFMKLEGSHIEYVLECLEESGSRIRNIKQYLLASLYNAPLTISSYYSAMYNADKLNGEI